MDAITLFIQGETAPVSELIFGLEPGRGVAVDIRPNDRSLRLRVEKLVRSARHRGLTLRLYSTSEVVAIDGHELTAGSAIVWCSNFEAYSDPDLVAIFGPEREPLAEPSPLPAGLPIRTGGREKSGMRQWVRDLEPSFEPTEYPLGGVEGPAFVAAWNRLRQIASNHGLATGEKVSVARVKGECRLFVQKEFPA